MAWQGSKGQARGFNNGYHWNSGEGEFVLEERSRWALWRRLAWRQEVDGAKEDKGSPTSDKEPDLREGLRLLRWTSSSVHPAKRIIGLQ
jgi:hypothetical protein